MSIVGWERQDIEVSSDSGLFKNIGELPTKYRVPQVALQMTEAKDIRPAKRYTKSMATGSLGRGCEVGSKLGLRLSVG
jgi:hypothetical protein